jgi:hypothetical protein
MRTRYVVVPAMVPGTAPEVDSRDLADALTAVEEVGARRDGDGIPFPLALAVLQLGRLTRFGFENDPWLALAAIEAKMRLLGLERRVTDAEPQPLANRLSRDDETGTRSVAIRTDCGKPRHGAGSWPFGSRDGARRGPRTRRGVLGIPPTPLAPAPGPA